MNPLDRRLRLRKSTVVNLDRNSASNAHGGLFLEPSGFACSWDDGSCYCTAGCPSNGCPEPTIPASCTTEPHIGCCRSALNC